ncbi:protein of unknown function [Blastococcus saxobsidens DD2]|uniref:Uncharacterized protein n=1 Tax=Blastococcus saxobsidens (strain DD2) TaxID=1146883 RepID=H6RK36_BLASD|nr:protein of unknown function [Blastococcus saxobsidens DD2]
MTTPSQRAERGTVCALADSTRRVWQWPVILSGPLEDSQVGPRTPVELRRRRCHQPRPGR